MSPAPEEQEELSAPISMSQTIAANIRTEGTFEAPVHPVGENANAPASGGKGDPLVPGDG